MPKKTPTANRRALVTVFCLLLLAACTETAAPESEPQITVAQPAPTAQSEEIARLPAPAPAVPLDVPSVAELTGLAPASVEAAIGTATFVRKDLGSEIWHYRTETCVLFLFLYENAGAQMVDHVQAAGGVSAEDCITSVVKARLNAKTG